MISAPHRLLACWDACSRWLVSCPILPCGPRQPGPRLGEVLMPLTNSDVLISGAGIAGPTLAYWLARYGFTPTVIERTPALRAGLGGHAVDLFGPAVDVAEWMCILPQVLDARTS